MTIEGGSVKMKQVLDDDFSQQELNKNIWYTKLVEEGDYVRAVKDEQCRNCLEVATKPSSKHGSVSGIVLNAPAYNCSYRLEFEFQWLGATGDVEESKKTIGPKEMKDVLMPLEAGRGRLLVQHWRLRPDRPGRGIYYKIWEKAIWSVTCDTKEGLAALVSSGEGAPVNETWKVPCERGEWYRMEVVNRPNGVQFRLFKVNGELVGESPQMAHQEELICGRIWFAVHADPPLMQKARYRNVKLEVEDKNWLKLEQTHLLVERSGSLMQVVDVVINSPECVKDAQILIDAVDEKGLIPEILSQDGKRWITQERLKIAAGWTRYKILAPWPGYNNELSISASFISGSKKLTVGTLEERCFARKCTIYVRPTLHCDIAWDMRIEDALQFYGHDQLKRIIDNLEKYPALKFTMEDSYWVYKGLEIEPGLKVRLEPLVKSGRFCIAMPWVSEEPDRSDEEAVIRNISISKKWLLDEFGVDSKVYIRLDPPGQVAGYPQLLKHAGVEIASTRRIPYVDADLPPQKSAEYFDYLYYRQGIDRTRMLYYWDEEVSAEYLFGIPWSLDPEMIREMLTIKGQRLYNCVKNTPDAVFVGTQGFECQLMRDDIGEIAAEYKSVYSYPNLEFVTLEDVLDIPELQPKNIRTIRRYQPDYFICNGDIGRGPITTSYTEARRNLVYWEVASSVKELAGLAEHDRKKFNDIWKRFVITLHHGCGVFNVPMADHNDFFRLDERNACAEIAKEEKEKNVTALVSGIDARKGAGKPLAVFNPLAWKRSAAVELPLEEDWKSDGAVLIDEKGGKVLCQVVKKSDGGATIVFTAKDVPSLGWRTYYLNSAKQVEQDSPMSASTRLVDTPFYRMELDAEGQITRLYNKVTEREMVDMPGVNGKDDSDRFAFNQARLLPDNTDGDDPPTFEFPGEKIKIARVEVEEAGPARVGLLFDGSIEGNPCQQRVRLYAEDPMLECINWIDFRKGQRNRRFMTFYPFRFVNRMWAYAADLRNRLKFTYWHPFAPAVLHDFDETGPDPANGWSGRIHAGQVDISQPEFGYSMATNPFAWAAVRDGVVAHTLFTTRFFCGTYQDHINQFIQERNVVIQPHDGPWQETTVWRLRHENNMPLMASWIYGKKGSLPESNSLLEVSADNVWVQSFKVADEDKNAVVIRLVEQIGQTAITTLRFNRKVVSAHEADIIERPGKALAFRGSEVELEIKPYKLISVRVMFA